MIGTLTGKIQYRDGQTIILDVHGVGYKVYLPATILSKIQSTGEELMLFTHLHVREDLLELYGFTDPADLKLFTYLIGVSGVGCKTALGIYAVGSRSAIMQAISAGDVAFFTAVPRLGKKNAQKIIIELKGKLGAKGDIDLSDGADDGELLSALRTFGFSTAEGQRAIQAVGGEEGSLEEKVRKALKFLGK